MSADVFRDGWLDIGKQGFVYDTRQEMVTPLLLARRVVCSTLTYRVWGDDAVVATRRQTDLLVAGGGPAGLAMAIAARLQGLEVTVLDHSYPPIDKACGEGLMPDGVERLEAMGVELDPGQTYPFVGIRYLDGSDVAEGRFPGRPGLGVRRPKLHAALVRRAAELGVTLHWGVQVQGFSDQGFSTTVGVLRSHWLVAADGLHSRLRRWIGLDAGARRCPRFGVRRHFRTTPWSDCVEVHWSDGCEAYVTPVGPELVGVALLWSGARVPFDTLLAQFRLAERLKGLPVASKDQGAGPLHQRARAVYSGRLALVGDASGYLDALTGEGLAIAFHQAFALAEALRRGDLNAYAREHRRLAALSDTMTRLLLLVERRPWLRHRMVRALAADAELFSHLLAIHCRALPARSLGARGVARLAWRLLAA